MSHRLLDDYAAIEQAICDARQRLIGEAGRLASLTSYPWIIETIKT